MHVFLSDALPPAAIARELASQLPGHAPTLFAWMQRLAAQVERMSPRDMGCTPAEAWALRRAGFVPPPGQRLGAGLGPLRAERAMPDQEPVWLADLVHLAWGARHQLRLTDPAQLVLSDVEDQALFDAVGSSLHGSGMAFARLSTGRWRVSLPAGFNLASASPAVVSGGQLDDWWPQDEASRPWRRLLNEIQMIWHEHPVNTARVAQGKLPVNSLWLYGGARTWPAPPISAPPVLICRDLTAPAAAGDWGAWLAALAVLDREVLATRIPLADRKAAPHIVLSGEDRLVTLWPASLFSFRNWLPDWFRQRTDSWTSWWHPPV